jgi:hypothetical protein
MFRSLSMVLVLALLCVSVSFTNEEGPSPGKPPGPGQVDYGERIPRDDRRTRSCFRDADLAKHPDYNAAVLQRFFAAMKALGRPTNRMTGRYLGHEGAVTKCSIYLEAAEAGAKVEPVR